MRFVHSITCGVLVAAASAHAQPSDADKLFEEGRQLAKAGNYAEACDRFAKSLAIERTSGTEVNLADCQDHLNHLREAWGLYVAAASDAETEGNKKRTELARERAAKLEPRMTTVIVKVAQPSLSGLLITIDGRSTPPAAEIHERSDPGQIDVIATAPNLPHFKKTATGVAGATIVVEIPPLDTALPVEHREPDKIIYVAGDRESGRVHLAYGLAAGGVAAVIGSVAFTLVGRSHYNTAADGPNCDRVGDDITCNDAGNQQVKDAQRLADYGTVAAVASAVLFSAAAIAYFTAPRDQVRVTPTATATSVGVAVGGTF